MSHSSSICYHVSVFTIFNLFYLPIISGVASPNRCSEMVDLTTTGFLNSIASR